MQLPFILVFEPPSRAELPAAVRSRWFWGMTLGLLVLSAAAAAAWRLDTPHQPGNGESATLQVSSLPSGSAVEVDGRARSQTPAAIPVTPGEHQVVVRRDGYVDALATLAGRAGEVTSASLDLWLRGPRVQRLRPAYPGTSITGGSFLGDGRIALAIAMPSGGGRQLWIVDDHGGISRVGPADVKGAMDLARDGSSRVAYLTPGKGSSLSTDERLAVVWISRDGGDMGSHRYSLPPSAGDEHLTDLSWAPDGRHLLVIGRRQLPARGPITRLLRLDLVGGEPKELAVLPSEVVAGSFNWSPDGRWVAFLTRASQLTSLCAIGIEDGEFRYLADLGQDDAGSLPFTPLAWSVDSQRVLYAAPAGDRQSSGWLLDTKPTPALFVADLAGTMPQRLGKAEGFFPTWRSDGSIIALARSRDGGNLTLQVVDARAESRQVAELPIKAAGAFSVLWDVAHAQALVAVRGSVSLGATQTDYWLVRFRAEVAE